VTAPYSFSVSLRVWHPTLDLNALTASLRMRPSNTWRVGEPRRTPAGKPLKGVHRDSFWTAPIIGKRFATSPRRSLEPSLSGVITKLTAHRTLLRRLRRTGGQAELFVGLFAEDLGNFGLDLPLDLLSRMSSVGLSLSLDIYS
jgi:hypothetical protein